MDPDLFHPGRGATVEAEQARTVCSTCPVVVECLEWAIVNNENHGIWGGLNAIERLAERRTRQAPARARRRTAVCGDPGGYQNHLRDGTEPCTACRESRAVYRQHTRPSRAKKPTVAA